MTDLHLQPSRRTLLLAGGLLPLSAAAQEPSGSQFALFGGSGRIEGSGNVIDDERRVAGFTKVIVNGPLDMQITAADTDRVVVRADDNIAPLVDTSVLGTTLVVGLKSGASYRTRTKMQIRVQAAGLQGVTMRGSGEIRIDRVDSDLFEATVQGSGDVRVDALRADTVAVSIAGNGDIRAKGTAATLGVVIDGNGDVHFADLVARTVAVSIRGSGDARVHATEELQVSISGSGDVRYRGSPKITKAISGSGSVEPLR
jgi:carbon monoxide dehydrogenase subunit G